MLLGNHYYYPPGSRLHHVCLRRRPNGPIHARNLDWWTEDQMLARLTCRCGHRTMGERSVPTMVKPRIVAHVVLFVDASHPP